MTVAHMKRWLGSAFGEPEDVPNAWIALLTGMDRDQSRRDAAFAEDLTALTPRLHTFARRLSGSEVQAEDLVQDTMARAWGYRHRFAHGSNLGAWTITILKRLYFTAKHRERLFGTYDDALEQSLSSAETQTATIMLGRVGEAIGQLREEYRVALVSVVIDGEAYDEVADRLGVPVGTIKSRVNRARKALITVMGGDEDELPAPVEERRDRTSVREYLRTTRRPLSQAGSPR